jgi:energy-coupling factor transport system permease protein
MDFLRGLMLGQYVPAESPVHRLDPRTKILGTMWLVGVLFATRSLAGLTVLTAFLGGVLAAGRIAPAYAVRGLRPVFWLVGIAVVFQVLFGDSGGHVLFRRGPLVVTRENLAAGVFYGYRLILLVAATTVMTFTTSSVELTDGLERLLRPFRRVGVPAHELALMMTIALRFIPTLFEETETIMKAQMARGAEFARGSLVARARALIPLLVPLFVGAFRRADALALAMEARGYRGGEHRTRMKELRVAVRDYVAAGMLLFVASIVLLPPSVWRAIAGR